jgi:hypothetical protein
MNLQPNLCYTIAIDAPGQDVHRRMARLLVTSLIYTGWHGRIAVFRNQPNPVLPEQHPKVEEYEFEVEPNADWRVLQSWKYRLRDRLDLRGIGKVLFLDCDCVALRSINHLMYGAWDIYTALEPGRLVEQPFNGYLTEGEMTSLNDQYGINAGTIGVRAEIFDAVMTEWERLDKLEPLRPSKCRDQHSWNRLILDTHLRHRPFGTGEVQFPFLRKATYLNYRRAALVHAASMGPKEKLPFLFGLWMDAFGHERFEESTAPPAVTDLSPTRPGRRRHSTRRVHSSAP